MKIERHAPVARGVSHLMYVGDDVATDPPTANPGGLSTAEKLAGVAAVAGYLGTRGITKAISGIVAVVIGYRWVRS